MRRKNLPKRTKRIQRTLEYVKKDKDQKPKVFSCFLLTFCCFLLIASNPALAKTLTVDPQGLADFCSIQAAVDQAQEGDTVLVYAGEYYENVFVGKRLALIAKNTFFSSGGERNLNDTNFGSSEVKVTESEVQLQQVNTEKTAFFKDFSATNAFLLPADPAKPALEIRAGNVTVRDFTIQTRESKRTGVGILLSGAKNCTLLNNMIMDMKRGIYLYNCTDCFLEENDLRSNLEALVLENSSSNLLRRNCMEWGKNGVYLKASDENRLFENRAEGFSSGFRLEECERNIIESNTADCNNLEGFYLLKAKENQLRNNRVIENFQYGISLETSTGNTLAQNDVQDNIQGITLKAASRENKVYDNQLFYCEKGLLVSEDSTENQIYNNTIRLWKTSNKSWLEELLD